MSNTGTLQVTPTSITATTPNVNIAPNTTINGSITGATGGYCRGDVSLNYNNDRFYGQATVGRDNYNNNYSGIRGGFRF